MTTKVISATRNTSLKDVAASMAYFQIAGVPVVEEGKKVVGVISEKDFLSNMGARDTKTFMGVVAACLKGKECVAVSVRGQNAEDIMTTPPVTVSEDTALVEIAGILKEKNLARPSRR